MIKSAAVPSYKRLLDDASKLLYDTSDTPRIDAEVLLQHVITRPMAWLIAYGDTLADSAHIRTFYAAINERQKGKPIAYITGSRDFWTLTLKVNKNVLIPRPDTETLVEHALQRIPSNQQSYILDLGTGSGAIALSLAKERPQAKISAVDFELAALETAKSNAELNNLNNVSFVQSSWFEALPKTPKFDLIAANPPYVEADDPHLQQGDLRFEPSSALIAAKHGISDLETIINTSPEYLTAQGWLIVEHAYNQKTEVAELFHNVGFTEISCFHDINDLPRCTAGQRKD